MSREGRKYLVRGIHMLESSDELFSSGKVSTFYSALILAHMGIELSMKGMLLCEGISMTEIRSFGHSLNDSYLKLLSINKSLYESKELEFELFFIEKYSSLEDITRIRYGVDNGMKHINMHLAKIGTKWSRKMLTYIRNQ